MVGVGWSVDGMVSLGCASSECKVFFFLLAVIIVLDCQQPLCLFSLSSGSSPVFFLHA